MTRKVEAREQAIAESLRKKKFAKLQWKGNTFEGVEYEKPTGLVSGFNNDWFNFFEG
jgi:hypothetical protein